MRFLLVLAISLIMGGLSGALSIIHAQEDFLPSLEPILAEPHNIEPLARFGRGHFTGMDFSPDGFYLAVGSTLGVWIFDAHDLTQDPVFLNQTTSAVQNVQFSPDGSLLASAGDGGMDLWETQFWSRKAILSEDRVQNIVFSPDSQTVAGYGWETYQIQLWSTAYPFEERVLVDPVLAGSVVFGDEGNSIVAIKLGDCCVSISSWNTATGIEELTPLNFGDVISNAAQFLLFPPDQNRLLVIGHRGQLGSFDSRTGTLINSSMVVSIDLTIDRLIFSEITPNVQQLLTVSRMGKLQYYDIETLEPLNTIKLDRAVEAVALNEANNQLVLRQNNTLSFYNLANHTLIDQFEEPELNSTALSVSTSGIIAAASGADILLWDSHTGEQIATLNGHIGNVNSVAFESDGETLLSAGDDGTIRIWNNLWENYHTMESDTLAPVTHLLTTTHGAVSVDINHTLQFYEAQNYGNPQVIQLGEPVGEITSLAADRQGNIYIAKDSFVWFCPYGEVIHCEQLTMVPPLTMLAVAASDNLFTAGYDLVVREWRQPNFSPYETYTTHNSWVYAIAIPKDMHSEGLVLAAAGCQKTVLTHWEGGVPYCIGGDLRLWSVRSIQDFLTIAPPAHTGPIYRLEFNSDGTLLVSLSDDGSIILWGVRSRF